MIMEKEKERFTLAFHSLVKEYTERNPGLYITVGNAYRASSYMNVEEASFSFCF